MRVQLGILQCIFLCGTAITVLKAPLPAYANDLLVTGALPVQPDIVVSQDGTGDFNLGERRSRIDSQRESRAQDLLH